MTIEDEIDKLDDLADAVEQSVVASAKYFDEYLMQDRFTKGVNRRFGYKPLAQSTRKSKTRGTILVDTGQLKRSVIGRGTISKRPGFVIIEYSPVKYGEYHITGTSRMPKRDWSKTDVIDHNNINSFIQKYIEEHGG